MCAVLIERYEGASLGKGGNWYGEVSVVVNLDFYSVTNCQELPVIVKSETQHFFALCLDIAELVVFVHAVNSANVLLLPRGSQMESFVAELDLLNCCSFSILEGALQSVGSFLCSHVIQNDLSIRKPNSEHEAVWVELNRWNRCFCLHLYKQVVVFDVVEWPTAIGGSTNDKVLISLEGEAADLLVTLDSINVPVVV